MAFHFAMQLVAADLPDQLGSETLLGRWRYGRTVLFLPAETHLLVFATPLFLPGNAHPPVVVRQRAVLGGVGAKLVQDQAEPKALLGVSGTGCP